MMDGPHHGETRLMLDGNENLGDPGRLQPFLWNKFVAFTVMVAERQICFIGSLGLKIRPVWGNLY